MTHQQILEDLAEAAREVLASAAHNVDAYAEHANLAVGRRRLERISTQAINRALEYIRDQKKSDRFLVFAYSSVLSQVDLQQVDKDVMAQFWASHGQLAININAPNIALDASWKALHQVHTPNSPLAIQAYSQIGTAARNMGDFAASISSYTTARRLAEEAHEAELAAWQIFRLGKMYLNYLQQPSRAFKYLHEAHSIFKNMSSFHGRKGEAASLDELGDVYRQATANLDHAEGLYTAAMEINEEIGYTSGIARNLAHLGQCAEKRSDYDRARLLLERSVRLTRQATGQERGVAIRLIQLARVCVKCGEIEYAEPLLSEALDLSNLFRDYKSVATHHIVLGQLLIQRMEFSKARDRFQDVISIAFSRKLFGLVDEAYDQLANLFSRHLEDYQQAKDALLRQARVREEAWTELQNTSPNLEEVEDKVEIANMYRSLFDRLLEDYRQHLDKTVNMTQIAYEIALRQREERYDNLARLFKFGALMSLIRHDILNLLNAVASDLDILERRIDASSLMQIVRTLKNRVHTGAELIRGPLAQSVIFNNSHGSRHAGSSARAVLTPIYESIKQQHARSPTEINICQEIPNVTLPVDGAIIQMSLLNLVQNACEAGTTRSKARIDITTEYDAKGKMLVIEVLDNCGGMSDVEVQQIFQMGYTSKPGHAGMGLPTVNFLIESVGGFIGVQSQYGKGSRFRLNLPISRR
jgi:signal transduction histidine kinase